MTALGQLVQNPYYPVIVVDRDEGVIAIVDEIDFRLPFAFERALEEVPNPRALLLHSPGGEVHAALAVAKRVHGLDMVTVISPDARCYSACAMIFLAGTSRHIDGQLGVHQIASETGDLVSGQVALADVVEVFDSFDVPSEVVAIMLRTPPDEMHVFSDEEIDRYSLNSGPKIDTSIETASPGQNEILSPGPADMAEAIGHGRCAVIVASLRTVNEAQKYVATNIAEGQLVQGYLSESGWIAVSIGTLQVGESDAVMAALKEAQDIPADSYCSQGRTLRGLVDIR